MGKGLAFGLRGERGSFGPLGKGKEREGRGEGLRPSGEWGRGRLAGLWPAGRAKGGEGRGSKALCGRAK